MNIALFSSYDTPVTVDYVHQIINYLTAKEHSFFIDQGLKSHFSSEQQEEYSFFNSKVRLDFPLDCVFSIGGDGTLLRSIPFVGDYGVPILGINTGTLGFLTSLQKESLSDGLNDFFEGRYSIVQRSLLKIVTDPPIEGIDEFPYALNEMVVYRKNTTSMLNIETEINGEKLTTYWADGLIIATATGSTGYSLSSGGPVLTPQSKNFVLNPIAPHNITMRPLIVPDDSRIALEVQGRAKNHLLTLDSRLVNVQNGHRIYIEKAPFEIQTVELQNTHFFATLRNKLFWGLDTRNAQ
ncbi:MAG: NAD kinase [Flavobacteriaceae bacterium]